MRSNSSHYDMTSHVRWLLSRDNTFVTKILCNNLEITTDYFFQIFSYDCPKYNTYAAIDTLTSPIRFCLLICSIYSAAMCHLMTELVARGKSRWRLFATTKRSWKVVEECVLTLIIQSIRLDGTVVWSLVPQRVVLFIVFG